MLLLLCGICSFYYEKHTGDLRRLDYDYTKYKQEQTDLMMREVLYYL